VTSRTLLLASASLLLLTACPKRLPPANLSADAAALAQQVATAQAQIRSVEGEARVRVSLPQGSGSVQQYIAAEKPDRLHLEALDFFGNQAAVLVAEGGRFALYDARAKTFYRGPATPANLARLVPLPLRAEDLVTILCGGAPLLDAPAVSAAAGDGFVALTLEDGGRRQVIHVGEGARPERSDVTGVDPAYTVRFDSFDTTTAGVRFPFGAKLKAAARKVEVEVSWRSAEVNTPLDARLFRLEPPKGAKVIELQDATEAGPPNLFEAPDAAPASAPPAS
jgi:outer membrane lipoprotein-sorting protein